MTRILGLLAVAAFIAACTNDPGERALTGAGIGAAAGTAGAAIVGESLIGGALIGGAVGAAAGALTDEEDIDLD